MVVAKLVVRPLLTPEDLGLFQSSAIWLGLNRKYDNKDKVAANGPLNNL